MWRPDDPLDTYGLAHFGSVAGDAMVAIALAGAVVFEIPPPEAGVGGGGFLRGATCPRGGGGAVRVRGFVRGPAARPRGTASGDLVGGGRAPSRGVHLRRAPVRHPAPVPL